MQTSSEASYINPSLQSNALLQACVIIVLCMDPSPTTDPMDFHKIWYEY
jgi:hypothetical protein